MCGIAGYFGNLDPTTLERLTNDISHRGPDDYGYAYFDDNRVGLGHRRLSIIDLSPLGHQPMYSADKSLILAFNGEIYNYLEIRRKLEGKYNFVSQSDSEVIIYAYQEWGIECLKHFNGMFAFVIYDQKRNQLFGARDRLGEKPLKYYFKDDLFVFASETKAIASFLGNKLQPDEIAIDNFLTHQYVPAPKTGFKDIQKLPPAHYFIYKSGSLNIERYWELDYTEKATHSAREWKELVLGELEKAVVARLVADVEVGAFLSGGIDSSAVVAFAARNSSNKIKTFSMGFDNKRFDETQYAETISKKYNTAHHVFHVTADDLLNSLDNVFSSYDEPFADNSALPTYLLSKETSKHVKVALTGDGGDENFAGYGRYNIIAISEYYKRVPEFLRKEIVNLVANLAFKLHPTQFTQRVKTFSSTFEEDFPRRYVNYNSIFSNELKYKLYHDRFRQSLGYNDAFDLYTPYYDKEIGLIDNALLADISTYLPEDLLYKTDIASMAHGLELRSPLLDPTFMEITAKMSQNLKINVFKKKLIFAEALVENDILPKEVVFRRKQGFNIPTNTWFKGKLKDFVYDTILTGKLYEAEVFDKARLRAYVDNYYTSNLNYDSHIYALLCLSKWFNRYFS